MKHVFITFATEKYMPFADRLCASALEHGGFDVARVYTLDDLDDTFKTRCQYILAQPRGVGYWLWKPYLVLKALHELCDPDDVLVYCDSLYLFNEDIRGFLKDKFNTSSIAIACNKPFDISFKEVAWSKGDAMHIINGIDDVACMDNSAVQAWGGFIGVINNLSGVSFVGAWLAYCEDPRLITDSPTKFSNHATFRENRHDQTVLSLLARRWSLHIFNFPSRYILNLQRSRPYIV